VEIHVEPGVAQRPSLALFGRLAPDEVLDIGMVRVEDHHLGCPTGLAARVVRDNVLHEVLVRSLNGQVKRLTLSRCLDTDGRPELVALCEALQGRARKLIGEPLNKGSGSEEAHGSWSESAAIGRECPSKLSVAAPPEVVKLRDSVRQVPLGLVGTGIL